MSSFEDKIVELATKRVLEPLFEPLFEDCSYGYRPERSPHQCLDTLGLDLGCRTFLSCISKGFGGFCSRLLRLRTGKLSSAFRLHGFADIF